MSDTSLRSYRAKRNFAVTTEPPPRDVAPGAEAMFVVQKHTARRAGLHWDFRLEHGGVLWSWAVPKGPSLDPADLRMAIHVEDHPVDYAEFQGTIPDGAYGAGSVETWDHGTWQPLDDPDAHERREPRCQVPSGALCRRARPRSSARWSRRRQLARSGCRR